MSYAVHLMAAFAGTLEKLAVSEEQALDSAKILSEDKRSRARRYLDSGTVGGALSPIVDAAGTFAEHAGNAKTDRVRAGLKGVKSMSRGAVAKSVTKGVLGGAAVRAAQEGLQVQRAKDTYRKFMAQEGGGAV